MKTILLIVLIGCSSSVFCQGVNYSFVFLNKKTDAAQIPKEELDKIMEGHMANINRLAEEGKLIAAGPFEGGGGIFIFNTTSTEDAKQWLSTDPGVKANRWNVEILPYRPRVGSVCAVKEPYEMVTYHFIRYTSSTGNSTSKDSPKINSKHDEHLKQLGKKGNVITEATFGETNEGILILNGELPKVEIESDPAVVEGLLTVDIKKLWIAKGAFCEK